MISDAMKYYWLGYAIIWLHVILAISTHLSFGGTVDRIYGQSGPGGFVFVLSFGFDLYALVAGMLVYTAGVD